MNRTLRLSSLTLALVVSLAMVAMTTGPAHAVTKAPVATRAVHPTTTVAPTHVVAARPRSTSAAGADRPVKPAGSHVYYMGNDYCGSWLHGPAWCLTFNKIEAGYISAVSLATATAFICAGTALITCAVAAAIAAAIQRYVDRNGVCPSSRPKMRVEYFPSVGRVTCA